MKTRSLAPWSLYFIASDGERGGQIINSDFDVVRKQSCREENKTGKEKLRERCLRLPAPCDRGSNQVPPDVQTRTGLAAAAAAVWTGHCGESQAPLTLQQLRLLRLKSRQSATGDPVLKTALPVRLLKPEASLTSRPLPAPFWGSGLSNGSEIRLGFISIFFVKILIRRTGMSGDSTLTTPHPVSVPSINFPSSCQSSLP